MPKFSLPKEVQVPEGIESGDKFQVMATLVLGENGSVELVEVDGNEIEGYEQGKTKKGKEGPAEKDDVFVSQMMGQMKGM